MEVVQEMFRVLSEKEKTVITKRFSLNNGPKQTLEKIGQHFSVTRERIRQIEKIALSKLRRTVSKTQLETINKISTEIINQHGGILSEEQILHKVLNMIDSPEDTSRYIIRLSLHINTELKKSDKSQLLKPFWFVNTLDKSQIKEIIKLGVNNLKQAGDVLSNQEITTQIKKEINNSKGLTSQTIISTLQADNRIKQTDTGFGLMTWRHINPQSIRDKAYIILKESEKPLHFVEIANKIIDAQFDRKMVTTQAVHNELIRYEQFILVGRGLYALKEWGYSKGTVSDVITKILQANSPLTKQEIIDEVLKQRQVKKGTISLNLQKNPQFIRVGRAVYALAK